MTQSTDQPNDRERSIDRQFRILDRRLTRLEETQLTGKEINLGFDRRQTTRKLRECRTGDLKKEMNQQFAEINTKLDIIIRHVTGSGNS